MIHTIYLGIIALLVVTLGNYINYLRQLVNITESARKDAIEYIKEIKGLK
jgi:hypothetical protein